MQDDGGSASSYYYIQKTASDIEDGVAGFVP